MGVGVVFEVISGIICAIFAVFGAYSFVVSLLRRAFGVREAIIAESFRDENEANALLECAPFLSENGRLIVLCKDNKTAGAFSGSGADIYIKG